MRLDCIDSLLSQRAVTGYVLPFMSETLSNQDPSRQLTNRIHRLADAVINQIAAGEVVERPASALKEIIENSLDAGATRIDVHLEEGGLSLLSVLDNGSGIFAEDLPLAIERHATSKLTSADDLDSILSFGFRGEALSSISAVSQLEIRTRRQENDTGSLLEVDFGTPNEIRPVGCKIGTQVSVRNLFGRIPARQKFLRTGATEGAHCLRTLRELALGTPSVSYFVHHNGKAIAKYTALTRLERLQEVLKPTWQPLIFRDNFEEMNFEAYLSPPESLQDRSELYLYVNGRSIKNRLILSSIRNSYLEVFGPHHEPSGTFYLDMRGDWVDVNVHPQKLDVRFYRQERIYGWILATLRKQLQKLKAPEKSGPVSQLSMGSIPTAPTGQDSRESSASPFLGRTSTGLYLFENTEGIWMLSQHTLLELRNRAELQTQLNAGKFLTRRLELPLLVTLNENIFRRLIPKMEILALAGIEWEIYGDRDIAVKTLPLRLESTDFLPLLEYWQVAQNSKVTELADFCLKLACVEAEKSATLLSLTEVGEISRDLLLSVDETTCPKGNPAPLHFNWAQIRKHFNQT